MPKFVQRIAKFIAENLMVITILICVSTCVLMRSYFDGYYISPDSANYLRAAREILRGNGFYVYPDWFGYWPIGYPALIALVSFLTHTELYLASKILSILIIWIIGIALIKRFGRTAWGYALVMLNVGFLEIFYYTWSEVPFVLGLIFFSFCISDILSDAHVRVFQYVKLTTASLLLFLSRYIGAFSIGVMCILLVYSIYVLYKHRNIVSKKRVIFLAASTLCAGAVIVFYLLMNRTMTGYMTGIERVPIDNYNELFINLYQAQLTEMNNVFSVIVTLEPIGVAPVLWLIWGGFVIYAISKYKIEVFAMRESTMTPLILTAVGVIYWFSIVAIRFSADFNNFSFRLLLPSTALLYLGFVGLLTHNKKMHGFLDKFGGLPDGPSKAGRFKVVPNVLLAVGLTLFIMISIVIVPQFENTASQNYREMKQSILETYAEVPDGSIILWEWDHNITFLREAIDYQYPVDTKSDTTIDEFFEHYIKYDAVYINTSLMRSRMDVDFQGNEELLAFFNQYLDREEVFIRVR